MYERQRPALQDAALLEPHNPEDSYPFPIEKIVDNAMTPWGVPKPDITHFHWIQLKFGVSCGWSQSLGLSVGSDPPPLLDAIHADRRLAYFQSRRSLEVWRESTLGRQLTGRFYSTTFKTRSDENNPAERGYPTASPWPALSLPAPDLDPVAAAWGRKLYPGTGGPRVAGPGLMFGLHHHQDAAGLHHHHQPRGPSLKEEPLTTTRAWMQPSMQDQNG
ncbi:hypothetical protein FQR65_LT10045 [Abscondita terminalis]|nr:hypothetical protein FQR65_LT10045 [Abscondita terminalis]